MYMCMYVCGEVCYFKGFFYFEVLMCLDKGVHTYTVVVHVLNLCHGKCTFVFVRYVCTVHITHLCWHLRYLRCILVQVLFPLTLMKVWLLSLLAVLPMR